MTTGRPLKTQPSPADWADLPEPLPDPPPVADMEQTKHITYADQTLETWFHGRRENVLVNGQGYLCADRQNVRRSPAPDCVVAFDVDVERITYTNGYVISEVGKRPEFVLEVASRSTGRNDYTTKQELYAALGVDEYWRFDHTGGRYHDAALAGDRLVDGTYVPIPLTRDADGVLWGHSAALELDLCWEQGQLRFYDPATESYLPRATELKDQRNAAVEQRDAALLENERLRELLARRQEE